MDNFFICDDTIINVDDISHVLRDKYCHHIWFKSKREPIIILGEDFDALVKFIEKRQKEKQNV